MSERCWLACASGLAGMVVLAGACGAANVRPYITPFPTAPVDTVTAEPEAVVDSIATWLQREGVTVRASSAAEGYVESRWFAAGQDTTAKRLGSKVRYRFWVDPIGLGKVQVVSEGAAEYVVDPSLPPRERETLIPKTHPGWNVVEDIRKLLHERFGQ